MTDNSQPSFVYLRATGNGVVPRFGSSGFIGAVYVPNKGFDVDTKKVVRILETSFRGNLKAYNRAIKDGAVEQASKEDFDAWEAALAEIEKKRIAEAEKKAKEQAKAESTTEEANNESNDDPAGDKEAKSSGGRKKTGGKR